MSQELPPEGVATRKSCHQRELPPEGATEPTHRWQELQECSSEPTERQEAWLAGANGAGCL